jgi:hypothetical protein
VHQNPLLHSLDEDLGVIVLFFFSCCIACGRENLCYMYIRITVT